MKSRLHASHCCVKGVRMNSDGVVFQHTSPCSYYGAEMSGGRGTLFRRSPPMLFLTQLSLTRMTCVTPAVSRSFGMDALSYQGLFIFQIKSLSCFQPRTPAGLKYIWETLETHGRGSFQALVSSPGALSRTINIDLLKIRTVHTCPFDEKDAASPRRVSSSHRYQTNPCSDLELIGFPDVLPCISLNPTPLQATVQP